MLSVPSVVKYVGMSSDPISVEPTAPSQAASPYVHSQPDSFPRDGLAYCFHAFSFLVEYLVRAAAF